MQRVVKSASTLGPLPAASRGALPNPSVKGTSCAKAQAAPYLER